MKFDPEFLAPDGSMMPAVFVNTVNAVNACWARRVKLRSKPVETQNLLSAHLPVLARREFVKITRS